MEIAEWVHAFNDPNSTATPFVFASYPSSEGLIAATATATGDGDYRDGDVHAAAVLVGDMNTEPGSRSIELLLEVAPAGTRKCGQCIALFFEAACNHLIFGTPRHTCVQVVRRSSTRGWLTTPPPTTPTPLLLSEVRPFPPPSPPPRARAIQPTRDDDSSPFLSCPDRGAPTGLSFPTWKPQKRIDFILVKRARHAVGVLDVRLMGNATLAPEKRDLHKEVSSDHLGVWALLSLPSLRDDRASPVLATTAPANNNNNDEL